MMYVKRSVFNKIKGFDPTIHFMEDSDLAQRIVQSGHSFRLLRHPKFIFSMRRYEKKGLVSYFRQMFQYYVAILIYHKSIPKEAYPMDGGVK
jgi:GT2 family glycosyltransferase